MLNGLYNRLLLVSSLLARLEALQGNPDMILVTVTAQNLVLFTLQSIYFVYVFNKGIPFNNFTIF